MKSALKLFLILLAFAILGCSSPGNKFVGKWKITGSRTQEVAIIEEKENGFDFYSEKTPDRYITFTYDEEREKLTSNSMGGTMDINFTTDEDHIEMKPRRAELYGSPQLFERLED